MLIKARLVAMVVLLLFASGCTKGISNVERAEYERMLGIKASMEEPLDQDKYRGVVEYLISDRVVVLSELEATIGEFEEYLTDNMLSVLMERASKDIENENTIDTETGDTEELVGEDFWEEWDGEELEDEWEAYEEDGMYPIYDRYFSVVRYGTKEEMITSIEDFRALPVNELLEGTVYPNLIIYRVLNKYQGEIAVVIKLVEGKVDRYEVFR